MRETVQYFGVIGDAQKAANGYESGPFYVGMSFEMNIPEYSIGLQGPTSTSKQKEIADRFAKGGMTITLNNTRGTTKWEPFWDSSWISSYPEEDERIFFGSQYKLQVETIILMGSGKDHRESIGAFYEFDQLLSGGYDVGSISRSDMDIVARSIEYALQRTLDAVDVDTYALDNFFAFTRNKTEIVLHLAYIHRYFKNVSFADFLMHSVREQGIDGVSANNINLIKPSIFRLFPNLTQITIYSTLYLEGNIEIYAFNFLSLLSVLSESAIPCSFNTVIIKDEFPNRSGKWLRNALPKRLRSALRTEHQGLFDRKEDWIVINI